MICQMMIIDKKGGWPASRPRGKGPQAASQPNTQVLTRPSTEGADTEQYTQYTELGVNTTPTDEHYQHKSNTMVPEYYIYQDRPFLMHKTESKAIDHLNHTHVLLSNTNNRECFDPSDSQYIRPNKAIQRCLLPSVVTTLAQGDHRHPSTLIIVYISSTDFHGKL